MSDIRPVPADWTPDCENCRWFLDEYDRSDLFLFQGGLYAGWHALSEPGAQTKRDRNDGTGREGDRH